MVAFLIKRGADLTIPSDIHNRSLTPLGLAVYYGLGDIAELLRKHGAT